MPFFENAIQFDTYLISDYPEVVSLADNLFEEVIGKDKRRTKTRMERYKSKETLKIILINLIVGYESGVAIRYSRRKSSYSKNRRYGKIFFKYDRVIPIINALIGSSYIEQWRGYHWQDQDIGRESRMSATGQLIELFHKFNIANIDYIGISPPEPDDLVILRDKNKSRIDFTDEKKKDQMTYSLLRYNGFIEKQEITFKLTEDVTVNFYFLKTELRPLVNKGMVKVTNFIAGEFINIESDGDKIEGYRLDRTEYIILDGTGSTRLKTNIINQNKNTKSSNYRKYYNQYINHIESKINKQNNNKNILINTNTPITGTNSDNSEENLALNVKKTTTVKPELQKKRLTDFYIHKLVFLSKYQYLHRVFNIYADEGGRFYGAIHMSLPKEVRKCIYINGSPTVELDYSALHIRMLYHEIDIDYREDPYQKLCMDNPEERPIYKIVLLVSINANNEKKSIMAIRKRLMDSGIAFDYTDKSIKTCIDDFKKVHEPISGFLNSGKGVELQYMDSRITDFILTTMVKENIPCLPIHDSFIVPAEWEKRLYEVMIEAYQKVVYGFMPIIQRVE